MRPTHDGDRLLGGRTAVVTGGARGIGLGIATRLAAHGARVALLDLEAQATAEAALGVQEATGSTVLGLAADVSDPSRIHIPLGGLGSPEAVADTYVYLASPLSSYVTGQHIVVDGGWSVGSA